jgi:hypothetical protein
MNDDLVERLREGFPTNLEYEAADRIEALEAALREIIDMHPFKNSEGDASVKAVVDLMFSINLVASAALGEKKDV